MFELLTIHRGMFKTAKTELRMLMAKSKADFYNSKITFPNNYVKWVSIVFN